MTHAKRVALITGGANGIGRAIAKYLLAAGWVVGIVDVARADMQRSFPTRMRNVGILFGVERRH